MSACPRAFALACKPPSTTHPSRAPCTTSGGSLSDADLLAEASARGFTVLVTTDKRLAEQQRHAGIAVLAVDDNRLSSLRAALPDIARAIRSLAPGDHALVATSVTCG